MNVYAVLELDDCIGRLETKLPLIFFNCNRLLLNAITLPDAIAKGAENVYNYGKEKVQKFKKWSGEQIKQIQQIK